ncbi:MAG: hypothetical protein ACYSOG_01105, partial [Planctomycetota bacterium]
ISEIKVPDLTIFSVIGPENAIFCSFLRFFHCKVLVILAEYVPKCCLSQRLADIIGTLTFTWRCQMAKKKAAKKKAKAKASKKEVLVVASKVKAYVKGKKMMTSADAVAALSDKVYALLDDAIARTKANRRSTVKPQDL